MHAPPPSWRCATTGSGGSLLVITPRYCACWRTAITISPDSAPKRSAGCTPCCASSHRAAPPGVSRPSGGHILRGIRPLEPVATERKRIAVDLLGDVRRFDSQLVALKQRTTEAVLASGTTVTDVHDVGPLGAAIIGHTGDITRFPDAGHFARYNATAPIAASSALKNRHRQAWDPNAPEATEAFVIEAVATCQIPYTDRPRFAWLAEHHADGVSGMGELCIDSRAHGQGGISYVRSW
jgi:Transposase IS116/IS110/IS902 family